MTTESLPLDTNLRAVVDAEIAKTAEALRNSSVEADLVARILRAHLVVEHAMRQHLAAACPNLDVDSLSLNFDRLRRAVFGLKDYGVGAWVNTGLQQLNVIRNRLAHRLDATISLDDVKPLQLGPGPSSNPPPDTAATCEMFAVTVSILLASTRALRDKLTDIEREHAVHAAAHALIAELDLEIED